MTTTNDILHSVFITQAQSRARLLQTVAKFASSYELSPSQYSFTVEEGHPSIGNIRFNPANTTFSVSCSVSPVAIDTRQQLDLEDELTGALRQHVLGPLALRALPADDKLRFLKAIAASRTQERALWNELDARYPRSTELDKAKMLAHVAAREVEPTSYPERLSATHQPWLEIATRRQLKNPSEDIPEIMRCLADEVRRHGMNSQKTTFRLSPLPPERPLHLAGSLSPVQIGDGYYEGHITGEFNSSDGTHFLIQRDRATGASLMHRADAFPDDVPYGCRPSPSDATVAIAYANGKATWEYPLRVQEQVAANLQQSLPPGASLHVSSPWDSTASFRGRIVASPEPRFVLQQDENNANTYYAHLAQAFDYAVHPKSGPVAQAQEQEPVEIGSDGAGRMIARPYVRTLAGVQNHDFAQQLKTLRHKLPPSAQALLQVAQPDARYYGPLLAHTPLFVLQGAYPAGQAKAVPVVHWRADLRRRNATVFNPEEHAPGSDMHAGYGRDGTVSTLFVNNPASWDLNTKPAQHSAPIPPADSQECELPAQSAQDAGQSAIAHRVLERNIAPIDHAQLNLGANTVLQNARAGSEYTGAVVGQDAHRIFLQLADAPRQVVVFPKAAFAASPLPAVDANTPVEVCYQLHRADVRQPHTLNIASSSSGHSTNHHPHLQVPANLMHARTNQTHALHL